MLDFIKSKRNCVGCTACLASCPVQCIEMKKDEEGFLYPFASDKCIHCNKCERVCPIANPIEITKQEHEAYAAVSKNYDVWKRSASGGAFSEICRVWGDENTLYVGAAWDGLGVKHIGVIGFDSILKLCKSKYVASDIGDSFRIIKDYLNNDQYALFCGTPCQVAGLRKYLGKDYEKLILIDLICHGVGSPNVFNTCMDVLGKQFGGKVTEYEFRTKRKIYERDHLQGVEVGGKHIYVKNDPYIQLFLSQICLRESCGANCKFRAENRQGDITIADFKGLTQVFPQKIGEKKNYSSVIGNSLKGKNIIKKLNQYMDIVPCDIEDIKKYNPLFFRQTIFATQRDAFFAEYVQDPVSTVINWTNSAQLADQSAKSKLFSILPVAFRSVVLRIWAKLSEGGMSYEPETSSCIFSSIRVEVMD